MPPKTPKAPSHDDVLNLAEKTRDLIKAIWDHPSMQSGPLNDVPPMLRHEADFVLRTFTDYIAPNLPPAKTSLDDCIKQGAPGAPPPSTQAVDDEAANEWPTLNKEKYTDIMTRNLMASKIVLQPDDFMVRMMFPGNSGFDFGEEIKEKARKLTE